MPAFRVLHFASYHLPYLGQLAQGLGFRVAELTRARDVLLAFLQPGWLCLRGLVLVSPLRKQLLVIFRAQVATPVVAFNTFHSFSRRPLGTNSHDRALAPAASSRHLPGP